MDRSEIAKALVNFKRPLKYEIGKPKFPTLTEKEQHLWQFVGQNSWFLLDKLELNASWLSKPTASWGEYEDYKKLKHFVENLVVVNDCAERSIKDITEFKDVTRDPEQREYILQVADYHRAQFSLKNINKNELEKI